MVGYTKETLIYCCILKFSERNGVSLSFDSLAVIDDKQEREGEPAEKELKQPDLSGSWQIITNGPNAITLDYCDYYLDNEFVEENGYVLNIQTPNLRAEKADSNKARI